MDQIPSKEEPGIVGKILLFLITITVFVGGVYDVGPSLITIGAILGAVIWAVSVHSNRLKQFGKGLVGLWLGYAILEWIGRLLGSALS